MRGVPSIRELRRRPTAPVPAEVEALASPLVSGPIRQRLAGRAAALENIAERHARTRNTLGDGDARR
jgi:hypothetical protein